MTSRYLSAHVEDQPPDHRCSCKRARRTATDQKTTPTPPHGTGREPVTAPHDTVNRRSCNETRDKCKERETERILKEKEKSGQWRRKSSVCPWRTAIPSDYEGRPAGTPPPSPRHDLTTPMSQTASSLPCVQTSRHKAPSRLANLLALVVESVRRRLLTVPGKLS